MKPQKQLYKDQPFIYRYPRTSVTAITVTALAILFSKPIYDFCFADASQVDVQEMLRTHKSRFGKT